MKKSNKNHLLATILSVTYIILIFVTYYKLVYLSNISLSTKILIMVMLSICSIMFSRKLLSIQDDSDGTNNNAMYCGSEELFTDDIEEALDIKELKFILTEDLDIIPEDRYDIDTVNTKFKEPISEIIPMMNELIKNMLVFKLISQRYIYLVPNTSENWAIISSIYTQWEQMYLSRDNKYIEITELICQINILSNENQTIVIYNLSAEDPNFHCSVVKTKYKQS